MRTDYDNGRVVVLAMYAITIKKKHAQKFDGLLYYPLHSLARLPLQQDNADSSDKPVIGDGLAREIP